MRFETVHLSGAARLITGQPRGDGAIGTPSAAAMGPQTLGAKAGVGNAERRRAASGKSRSTPLPDIPPSFEIKVTVEPSAMLALRPLKAVPTMAKVLLTLEQAVKISRSNEGHG